MIITCPACSAKFVVKAEAIGENGRKVRCAKCKHEWHQQGSQEALEAAKDAVKDPESVDPIPNGGGLPAYGSKGFKFLKIAFAASLVFLFITVSIVAGNSFVKIIPWYYKIFGIINTENISLYDVKVEKVQSGKYYDLVVTGRIVNESPEQRVLPNVRLKILDESDGEIKSVTLNSGYEPVEAGEGFNFENTIKQIPKDSTTVIMDIGNSIDLASR